MTTTPRLRILSSWLLAGVVLSGALSAQSEEPEATAIGSQTVPPGIQVVTAEQEVEPDRAELPDPGETFVNANRAYEDGDFARAAELFRLLTAAGFDDGRLHFNLGNAQLRNGQLGRAIASYRRSRNRLPRDEDVLANLDFARKSTKDAIAAPGPTPVMSTLFFWHYGLSLNELEISVLVLNLLFWSIWLVRIFHRDSEVLRWILILLLVLLLGSASSLAAHRFFTPLVAVVVPQEVEARTGPDPEAVVRFKLHAGTEVEVRDRRQDWLRIALPDGQQGWVDDDWLEVVDN